MDPLSLTVSIIAILQLTSTLTSYINQTRNAAKDQAKVAVEASNIYNLLTTLRFRVEEARSDDRWFNYVKLLGVKNGPLDQLKDILKTMVDKLPSYRKRDQIKSTLLWKFTNTEVEDALARIERLQSLVSLALADDLTTLSKAIRDDTLIVKQQTERLLTLAEQDLQNKLSHWLSILDPSTNYHAAL